jgi:hypothetical protein
MSNFKNALSLVKAIGLPCKIDGQPVMTSEKMSLLNLAETNKIPLLYLESQRFKDDPFFENQRSIYQNRHQHTLALAVQVSELFEKYGVKYVFFKTLKPFLYTPSDVDVLVWSKTDLEKACLVLKANGFRVLDSDFYGSTLYSPTHQLNVDLTLEVAVSGFVYLNKARLFDCSGQVKIGGSDVNTLKPYADLVTIAAYCLYKEQMFLLSDYYSLAVCADRLGEALIFADSVHVESTLMYATQLACNITQAAFGSENILKKALGCTLNANEVNERFDLPKKYPLNIVASAFTKKLLEDSKARNSLKISLGGLGSKSVSSLFGHFFRKGY